MLSLPLFHRIAGQPVIVLGEGEAAAAKRRLVTRAGGEIVTDIQQGVDRGARLAFVAHDNPQAVEGDVIRLRCAGLLVNATDRPELCDFTVPSLVDRAPVLIAVGTGGASAGLAKAVRLRLERLLPQGLGALADALHAARAGLRARFPEASDRRRALDAALEDGGPLDVLRADAAGQVAGWLDGAHSQHVAPVEITLRSDDPDDLTLREARLLGQADALVHDAGIPPAILTRARADAVRIPAGGAVPGEGLVVILRHSGN
ncbi:precorrin-2 dehydrogenase/sirohydrochlorin ferrochelatase family protein [Novosphingobium lentum]|uniref:precorrin-2 dehydrogenase/sirohydrochlorin ferrochelatase family protein n=1 Tax=Novosphingobium lentum TaxID=145287 RepID=UPI00083167DE|nr:NAD(P)-dependent oxidoreductase [Novosphingobium lentum]